MHTWRDSRHSPRHARQGHWWTPALPTPRTAWTFLASFTLALVVLGGLALAVAQEAQGATVRPGVRPTLQGIAPVSTTTTRCRTWSLTPTRHVVRCGRSVTLVRGTR